MKRNSACKIPSIILSTILTFVLIISNFSVVCNASTSMKINASLSMTSAFIGGTATVKATASGGTAPYSYKFLYRIGTGSWVTTKSYSTGAEVSISIVKAGEYTFRSFAKDKNSVEVYCDMKVNVGEEYSALVNKSSVSASSVSLGKSITIKGNATGGTLPYSYAYFYTPQDGTKHTIKSYSSSSSATIVLPNSGYYNLQCIIKDKQGNTSSKSFSVSITNKTGKTLINNSVISSSNISLGTNIKINGKSSGGTQPCQYAFYYSVSGNSYKTLRTFGKSATYNFKPTSAVYYKIKISAKDTDGTIKSKIINLTVKNTTNTALANKSAVSVSGNAEKNTTVIMQAKASGGTQPYKFSYYYRLGSDNWNKISSYSTVTSSICKLSSIGTYTLRVVVKDADGNIASKNFTIKTINGTSSGKTESVSVDYGLSTVMKAANTKSGSTYAFFYKDANSSYKQFSSYSSTSSVSYRPRKVNDYTFIIYSKYNNITTNKIVTINARISPVAKSELDRINAERKKAGVSPLSLDNELTYVAGIRAEEIKKSYSHTRPDGRICYTVLSDNNISYKSSAGENIAYGYKDYSAVMDAWMKSQGHKDNILNKNFTKVGIGIYEKYWTQLFSD